MNFNTSDYFTYKKNKMDAEPPAPPPKKQISKINYLLQLFIATFIIMFIVIVIVIMKYTSKVDIEYTQGELSLSNTEIQNNISGFDAEDKQGRIDTRLLLIQQEENAPSEAKILAQQPENSAVIDSVHIENNNKIEKQVKEEENKNKPNLVIPDKEENPVIEAINEIKNHTKKTVEPVPLPENKNVTVMSKVLVGKFSTFEDAQYYQAEVKNRVANSSPFVRKVGEVFTVQMGSYQDFEVARKQAQTLKGQGFDVWIYQQ